MWVGGRELKPIIGCAGGENSPIEVFRHQRIYQFHDKLDENRRT